MRYFGFLLLLLTCCPALGQRLYRIQQFSPKYYGKVWLAEPNEVFSPGWVAVYERALGKLLLKVTSDELAAGVAGGQVKSNVHNLPYGEQSVLLYEDFNFDGIKDFALEDGQNSCYHGPSFRIYLAKNNGFVFSAAFTRLAQEYCGMFVVDRVHKRLSTMTKSGCCWHQFSQYVVRNNQPQVVKIVEESIQAPPLVETTTQRWNGKKMVRRKTITLDLADAHQKPVLSFRLAGTGKQVLLLSDGEQLSYALLNAAGEVEFYYPDPAAETPDTPFTLSRSGPAATLIFQNSSAVYRLYEKPAGTGSPRVGIEVTANGKTLNLPGQPTTSRGSLAQVAAQKLVNVAQP
ncbi:MAG: XAC2610-related protein [Janthinobacterium lividum]